MNLPASNTHIDSTNSNSRLAGFALVGVSVLAAVVMSHHPVAGGSDIGAVTAEISRLAWLDRVVHGTLMALLAVSLLSYVEISHHLGFAHSLVRSALVAYAIGTGAMFGAALIDGFVLSWLGESYAQASAADLQAFRHILRLTFSSNQALADFGTLAMSAGYGFWSVALLRRPTVSRWLGISGILLATLPAFALLSGLLRLDMHGMLGVIVGQSLWNVALGVQLIRGKV
jgi:hypothetical protein